MKRIISFILSLTIVLSMLVTSGISVSAADGTTSTGLVYMINEDGSTVTISDYTGTDTEVVIPDSIEGMAVTSIGYETFENCTSLISIKLPYGITNIGWDAFDGCSSLTSIEIPDSVTDIGGFAFRNCTSLTSIEIPDGVTFIGYFAFNNCVGLTSIEIPASVTSIGDVVFGGCTNLESITVDEKNTTYSSVDGVLFNKEKTALLECPEGKVGSCIIPASVTRIGPEGMSLSRINDSVFDNCTRLTSIIVDEGNEKYSSIDGVLFNKKKTGLIRYPVGKTESSYVVPDGTIWIDSGSFDGCNITSIEIPVSVTEFLVRSFSDIKYLGQIVYLGTEAQWNEIYISDLLDAEIIFSVTGVAGDLNGDETINTKDLTRLMKFIAGDDVTANGADVTGDGKVDTKDLTRLMRYLAGEKVELA